MKRITLLAGILGLAVFLSGCDKCGNFGPLFGLVLQAVYPGLAYS